MSTKKELTPTKRMKSEEIRLRRIYKKIDDDNKSIIDGLINRAAFMRITLEDWEKDIDENGFVELFTQSEKMDAYERERPVMRLYNTMNKNYQSIIKQLSDLIPRYEPEEKDDGFEDFVMNR